MKRALLLFIGLTIVFGVCLLSEPVSAKRRASPSVHVVYAGQTLGRIAKRYNVTIDAICNATGISRRNPIKPGQRLLIPKRSDKGGEAAKKQRLRGVFKSKLKPPASAKQAGQKAKKRLLKKKPRAKRKPIKRTWLKYKKPARRPGYVVLRATGRSWKGYAIVKGNRVSGRARKGFKRTLYSWRTGNEVPIDSRLIRLLTKVSDEFGGRPLKIASGYREHSHSKESRHKHGQACDFSIPGVPNKVLSDYLRTLDNVGVGYYPNSSFVHLDVRPRSTWWVDLSRPGQRPRYAHKMKRAKSTAKRPRPAQAAVANVKESRDNSAETVTPASAERTPPATGQ